MLSPMSETAQLFTPLSFLTVRSMPEEQAAHVIPVIEYFFSIFFLKFPFQLSFLMSSTVSETIFSSPALIFSATQVFI